jgi:hypothetical protein
MLYSRCNPDTIEGNCDRDALLPIHLPLPPRFAINVVKNLLSIHHIRGVAANMGALQQIRGDDPIAPYCIGSNLGKLIKLPI